MGVGLFFLAVYIEMLLFFTFFFFTLIFITLIGFIQPNAMSNINHKNELA